MQKCAGQPGAEDPDAAVLLPACCSGVHASEVGVNAPEVVKPVGRIDPHRRETCRLQRVPDVTGRREGSRGCPALRELPHAVQDLLVPKSGVPRRGEAVQEPGRDRPAGDGAPLGEACDGVAVVQGQPHPRVQPAAVPAGQRRRALVDQDPMQVSDFRAQWAQGQEVRAAQGMGLEAHQMQARARRRAAQKFLGREQAIKTGAEAEFADVDRVAITQGGEALGQVIQFEVDPPSLGDPVAAVMAAVMVAAMVAAMVGVAAVIEVAEHPRPRRAVPELELRVGKHGGCGIETASMIWRWLAPVPLRAQGAGPVITACAGSVIHSLKLPGYSAGSVPPAWTRPRML